ncbi:nuclear transport factor 2 [Methylorubrum populi]|uniref:Nuclear transport factor 2 n=1 Tax=Methylorubrum populi TaxID=223967 RepID=A0A160PCA5_9HYPH|nr:nuclear transport factor 2 family protein [Methylorubrum populi]BAU89925.1 nuclear transport factor 2 [Methylorubrum populi]
MHSEIQALADGFAQVFNAGRTGDLAVLYAPEARIVPPGRPAVAGSDQICGFFSDIRAQGFRDYAVEVGDVFARDGVVVASGRWRLTGPGPDGPHHAYEGNWLNLLDREPGGWRILVHMWN